MRLMLAVATLGIAVACGRNLDLIEGDGGAARGTDQRDAAIDDAAVDHVVTPEPDAAGEAGAEPDGEFVCGAHETSMLATMGDCTEHREKKGCRTAPEPGGQPCRVGEPDQYSCTLCVETPLHQYSYATLRCRCELVQ